MGDCNQYDCFACGGTVVRGAHGGVGHFAGFKPAENFFDSSMRALRCLSFIYLFFQSPPKQLLEIILKRIQRAYQKFFALF